MFLLFLTLFVSSLGDILIVPIPNTDEAWEVTTYGARVLNTWRSNHDMCLARGATLLEIGDASLNDQVASLAGKTGVWLGLLYKGENEFDWFSGQSLSYSPWARGYPTTSETRYYAYIRSDGTWATANGAADMKPVCMRRIKQVDREREGRTDIRKTTNMSKTEMVATEKAMEETEAPYKPKIYLNGMILHVDESPSTWLNAYYFCKRKGLGLPTVLTENFNIILSRVVGQLGYPVWLSLVGAGGRFWWMNGVPFEYNSLAESYLLSEKESTYTLLKSDGKWHGSCAAGNGDEELCELGLALCVEIAPAATAEIMEENLWNNEDNEQITDPITTTTDQPVYTADPMATTSMSNGNYAVESEKERLVYGTTAGTSSTGPCFDAISKAKERERISRNSVFYPFCEDDGTFRALQCGTQTCWCVTSEGRLFADSIDGTRERTTEECFDYRAREFETNEIDEPTDLCVVSARVYSAGERFMVDCQTCTCVGKNEIICLPSEECTQEEIFCDYMTSFDFSCSKCSCNDGRKSYSCLTYDRYCGREMTVEDNKIWYAYTNMNVEPTTSMPLYTGKGNDHEIMFEVTDLVVPGTTDSPDTEESERKTEKGATTESIATEKEEVATPTIFHFDESDRQYRVTLYTAEKKTSWIDAYYDCQSMGMVLPTDLDEVLNTYLSNFLRHHMMEIWLNAEQSNGYAYWYTGAEMDYTNWSPYSYPEYNYGRAYVTLSYDGMWYTKSDYEEANYYCVKMEQVTAPRALKMAATMDRCLIGEKEYQKGETFARGCGRCTCLLYSTVYSDCLRSVDCREVEPTQPIVEEVVEKITEPRRVKSKCHGGARFQDCTSPCERECGDEHCRRHCTKECSCPPERPVFYGGCCVAEAVCIDDGWF